MVLPTCEHVPPWKVPLQTRKRCVSCLGQSWGVPGAEETADAFIEKMTDRQEYISSRALSFTSLEI